MGMYILYDESGEVVLMQQQPIDESLARPAGQTALYVETTLDGEEAFMDYEVVGGVCQLKAGETAGRRNMKQALDRPPAE